MTMQPWDVDPNSVDLSQYQRNLADTGYKQAKYNRPDTFGLFGQQTTGADGSVNLGFSGQFGQINDALAGQAANAAAHPMDWGQFGTMGTGEDAGRQTAQAAYSQSLSRLNPFWDKAEGKARTNLFQSGMGDSDAGDATMGEFGRARNDAYAGAMTGALQQGMQAQQSAFQGNLASRQNNVANALRGQMQPFQELQGMQGFLDQPQYNRDGSMLMRDASFNQMAPVSAMADKEQALIDRANDIHGAQFVDRPGERPGAGERRRKAFAALPPELKEFYVRTAGAGSSMIDPGE